MKATRREALGVLATAGLVGISGGVEAQLQGVDDPPTIYGLLVDTGQPPAPESLYLEAWDRYRFIYINDRTGGQYNISHTDAAWTHLPTQLRAYDDVAALPSTDAVPAGFLAFVENRRVPVWQDGNNYEFPTFVDNNDVATASSTITNTTAETKSFTVGVDANDVDVKGRVFVLKTMGQYSTASSSDGFTYRVYTGDSGFDPTAGEGNKVADIDTVQENVTDGAWQTTTTITIRSTGASGTMGTHLEATFNNNNKDDHTDPSAIDTTTSEEFIATVEWNNAKTGNSVTREEAYLTQMA